MALGTKLLPMATKALPGIATGALSALTDFGVSKALGGNQKGGFLIPQNKINELMARNSPLTKKQKEQVMTALKSGGQLVIKPTPKQRGGFLGTLLASIGIPILMKALTGRGMQNRRYKVPRAPRAPPTTPKKSGNGLQNRPYSDMFLPFNPPPFNGSWGDPTNALGRGMKKSKKKKNTAGKGAPSREKQPVQKHPSTWSDLLKPQFKNTPITNVDINKWMKYLNIINFHGVYSRNEFHNCTKMGFYVINLDDNVGLGTHWVGMYIKPNIIEYFDSFGLHCPEEIVHLSNILRVNYLYNSSQYQDLSSVLCGYYCIYWINELNKGKTYYDTIKVFKKTDTKFNERLIKSYFM